MKKKLGGIFAIILLILLVDWFFFVTDLLSANRLRYSVTFFLLIALLVFLLITNLTYKKLFDFNSSKLKILFIIIVSMVISMVLSDRLLDINKYYYFSRTSPKALSNNLWENDIHLAHRGIPDAVGYYEYSIGDSVSGKIEVRFDSSGYRTTAEDKAIKSDTINLFLGCSFTFGDYAIAEEGFPYLTSKLLAQNLINAGASAYGIGQMKQLIDSLLAKHKFNYVFIQLSPWLADRAMNLNGPTSFGYRPFPYFSEEQDGFNLNYPAYKTRMYDKKSWSRNKKTYFEKIQFTFTEGFKIEIIDFMSFNWAKIKVRLGVLPAPAENKLELEKHFYSYAIERVKENGATPVLLKLQYPNEQCNELLVTIADKAEIVDLDLALENIVKNTGQDYKTLFHIYHLHNGKKLFYDNHFNAYANEVISNYIYRNLKTN